jgi:osmotically-inducible protein OsmY
MCARIRSQALGILAGRVRTLELKEAAAEVARSTPGVLSVDNQLIADKELVSAVEHALRSEGVHAADLEITALLGRVTLRGRVASRADRDAVERLALTVPGVESVFNAIEVVSADRIS